MGNIHRSPIAEQFFKRKLASSEYSHISVSSYGIQGHYRAPPSGTCLADYPEQEAATTPILEEKGIDISAHRRNSLYPDDINEATLILTLEEKVQEILLEECPSAKEKIYLLSSFPPEPVKCADVGESVDKNKHRQTIENIEYCIETGFYAIINKAEELATETFNKTQRVEQQ